MSGLVTSYENRVFWEHWTPSMLPFQELLRFISRFLHSLKLAASFSEKARPKPKSGVCFIWKTREIFGGCEVVSLQTSSENLRCESTGNEWTTNLKWFDMGIHILQQEWWRFFIHHFYFRNDFHDFQEYDPETIASFSRSVWFVSLGLDDSTKANSPSYSIWMIIDRSRDDKMCGETSNTKPGLGPSRSFV